MQNRDISVNQGKSLALWFSLVLFCWFTSASAALPDGIDVSLQPLQVKVGQADQVLIQVTYRNITSQPIKVLSWETALAGRVDEDFLNIVYDGYVLPYSGRHYKRAAPTERDYVTIEPGASVAAIVDITTGYELNYQGDYLISAKADYHHTAYNALPRLNAPQIRLTLTADRPITFKQTPVVSNCIGDRPGQINSALGSAESIARRARDDLRNTPASLRGSARRYQEWFGAYSEGRWNKVQNNFDRIYSAISGRTITFICDDSEPNIFAYVYPSQPYNVYLGGIFWQVPQTGTDSKAGTIIHEISHFIVVADTDDVVYGQSGARRLADDNPSDAIRNADSHEYFAENTPGLSMPTAVTPEPEPEPEPEPQPFIIHILQLLLLDD